MKRAVIYARVSTQDQDPGMQLAELRRYADRRDFSVEAEYVDQVTGDVKRTRRAPQYEALMRDARARRFDVVLVWKFDRFARSLQALLEALQTFGALGIDFISSTQDIDTTCSMGRLFFQVVGAFGEFERSLIVERTRAGIANARRRGVTFGRPRDHAQETRILRLRREGLSIRAIARLEKKSAPGVKLVCDRAAP
jgi:DNA invertase Pin-like site-specific DNA recombinase